MNIPSLVSVIYPLHKLHGSTIAQNFSILPSDHEYVLEGSETSKWVEYNAEQDVHRMGTKTCFAVKATARHTSTNPFYPSAKTRQ